jgi:hypothetical protein
MRSEKRYRFGVRENYCSVITFNGLYVPRLQRFSSACRKGIENQVVPEVNGCRFCSVSQAVRRGENEKCKRKAKTAGQDEPTVYDRVSMIDDFRQINV